MADDSVEIPERNFTRPSDSPRNTHYYNLPILTKEQQQKLNKLKHNVNIEDEKYLADHPEVRGCIALGLRNILRLKPRSNILETFAKYYAKSKIDLQQDVTNYLADRNVIGHEELPLVYTPSESTIECRCSTSTVSSHSIDISRGTFERRENPLQDVKEVLSEIIENVVDLDNLSEFKAIDIILEIVDNFKMRTLSRVSHFEFGYANTFSTLIKDVVTKVSNIAEDKEKK